MAAATEGFMINLKFSLPSIPKHPIWGRFMVDQLIDIVRKPGLEQEA